MLRIGLTQRVVVDSERNERSDCLDQAWTTLLIREGYWPIPIPNRIDDIDSFITDTAFDGLILTGGNDLAHLPGARHQAAERDSLERQLIELSGKKCIPLLGVCRGLQVIVSHYGGNLRPVADHAAVHHPLSVCATSSIAIADGQVVNSFHGFGCVPEGIGTELLALATSADGIVEAVAHRTKPQWGVMWHPERALDDEFSAELLHDAFCGAVA